LGSLPHLIPLPSGNMARLQQKFFIPSYRVSLLFFIVHFLQAKHLFRHLKLTQKSEHFGSSYRKNFLSSPSNRTSGLSNVLPQNNKARQSMQNCLALFHPTLLRRYPSAFPATICRNRKSFMLPHGMSEQ